MDLGQKTLFGNRTITSVNYDEQQIIRDILYLHCNGNDIELDPTYSIGNFYKKGLKKPKYKFDLNPQIEGVEQADSGNIPLANNSVNVIMFDPPFMFGKHGKTDENIMCKRFSMYEDWNELELHYKRSLIEFYRLLKNKGIVIFKCQDYTDSKTTLTHNYVHNWAVSIGFYPKDLFILFSKGAIINTNLKQKHARKYHSYYYVFEKNNARGKYFFPQ